MELEALVQEGTINESYFPYTDQRSRHLHPLQLIPRVKFAEWHRIPCSDIAAIKTAIMTYGVVDVAVYAGSAFQAYSGGIYQDTNTSCSCQPLRLYHRPTTPWPWWAGTTPTAPGSCATPGAPPGARTATCASSTPSAIVACEATYLVYSVVPGITVTAPSSGFQLGGRHHPGHHLDRVRHPRRQRQDRTVQGRRQGAGHRRRDRQRRQLTTGRSRPRWRPAATTWCASPPPTPPTATTATSSPSPSPRPPSP